jgi:hypothetical protein
MEEKGKSERTKKENGGLENGVNNHF